jgi:negative regulator of flagellin synthesis FlgM
LSAAAGVVASVGSDDSFDAQKVERLSHAIREGSFRIDADAIADKLIHNARELLNRN